jgi:protein-S-isoprenylcysteine O-methyltransferase Ste14
MFRTILDNLQLRNILVLAIGFSIFLPLLFESMWFYIGFVVFILGTLLLSLATYSFITAPPDELIQKGVYGISRNPMYLATFLILLSAGVSSASFILIILSVIIFICLYYEALVEERYCSKI